jgi:predicted helicase
MVSYRPFDDKWTYFDNKLVWRWRIEVMQNFLKGENVGLVIPKINKEDNCFFIANKIIAHKLCSAYDSNSIFPLYIYPETNGQQTIEPTLARIPNLNQTIIKQIVEKLGLTFINEKGVSTFTNLESFAPIDILDYIYAVLHCPTYREKYKVFLKTEFPSIPYPNDVETFWQLVALGGELRQIHLLESSLLNKYITKYPVPGDNTVGKINFHEQKVYINDTQYFENVPQVAWDFYIGGYQPAQKWLKDRKDSILEFADIQHYQKIIVALSETNRIMSEIDKIDID